LQLNAELTSTLWTSDDGAPHITYGASTGKLRKLEELPMKSEHALLSVASAIVVLALTAFAAKSTANYNITATMFNYDANNEPHSLQSDGSTSAVYDPSTDSSISSYLYTSPACKTCGTSAFEWDLDVSQSSRSFLVTLTPINSSVGPFTGPVAFNGTLRSRCFDPANNVFSWLAIQTSDTNCAMRVDFTYYNVNYTLVMSPTESGTGTATVTCTNWNSTTATCSAWTDVPTTGVTNANVAHLYSVGRGGSMKPIGSYALSFDLSLTHP
jgi:hypothetical protein